MQILFESKAACSGHGLPACSARVAVERAMSSLRTQAHLCTCPMGYPENMMTAATNFYERLHSHGEGQHKKSS
jgi:hypothetical protein